MNQSLFLVFFLFLFIPKVSLSSPNCQSILTIERFNKLSNKEKRNQIHPYLLQVFCNSANREKYFELYLNTFKTKNQKKQRLDELTHQLHKVILGNKNAEFYEFINEVIDRIEGSIPQLKTEIAFINFKFTYYNNRYGNLKACNYLNEYSQLANKDATNSMKFYNHLLKLSKCAEYADDYNASIYYLLKALEITKQLKYPKSRLKSGHIYKSLSMRYYELKDYQNTEIYADSAINTFLPDFKHKIGLAVGYEYKALALYQRHKDYKHALQYLGNAQHIYKKIGNISRYHFVERLKAEVYSTKNPDLATKHLLNHINYFQKNKRKLHQTKAWLLAYEILESNKLEALPTTSNFTLTKKRIIDSLTGFLNEEELQNQLKITNTLIDYYSIFLETDSLIKYNHLQNRLEVKRDQHNLKQKQTNVNLYLNNYKKEQELTQLSLLNQEQSYKNKLLSSLICIVVIALIFYFFYKRKQKQILLAQLKLEETEHNKLKTEQKLKEELILKKEQAEKMLKLAYDNELKSKELLKLKLQQKQNQVEAAQLEKQSSVNLLNEVFLALKDEKVNDASHLLKKLQTDEIIKKHNNSLKEVFESISPNFMQQLNKINANLTEQDILYCVLIRQKYSTKQIADFLSISPKSVNQHKYRLKKKLAISKEENINTFIANIKNE
ncbi:regulatory protein, luxR family [Psychroflexus salarius]|uniref:Regulatory protein, luxR family n=1 Tax=Psychroflexus salarius TaxID=1155689 RepID=A0A1M4XX98_9FLAO|nr:LuxR C-terminal-related transcriptional regulator [Psychroflexus salarius]SHE97872.1 regulatory protein, luxR family [Psychroflexus salarius]